MRIYRLKPNKKEKLLGWGKQIMGIYKQEALEAIAEENCSHEFGFIFSIGGIDYAALHMEGKNILPATDRKLNREHKEILKDCIECPIELELIYDLLID